MDSSAACCLEIYTAASPVCPDQFPEGTSESIMNGGLPQGLSADLIEQIKTVFAEAFQHMFLIGTLFAARGVPDLLVHEERGAPTSARG
ncbi:hypothetical protein ACFPYJ_10940 [Paenibacillus solisilvae]|uniref:Uncharacterized protein n=1 Tax=Paenibacillus solisilvae TaxID=2486751 RepID=A0ABW0VUZ3_9BACL